MNFKYSVLFVSFSFLGIFILDVSLAQFLELQVESYKICRYDKDCKENSFCHNNDNAHFGVCKCKNGFDLFRNKTYYECFNASKFGGPCTQDYHCQIHLDDLGVCDKNKKVCKCLEGSHDDPSNGLCYKTINLTDPCLSDKNCLLDNGHYAYCADGHCSCAGHHVPSANKRNCILKRNLGEGCGSDLECEFTPHARCEKVCRCHIQYTLSRNGTTCLQAATEFGQKCIEDVQCSKYLERSYCRNGKCVCPDGYHGYLTRCLETSDIGGYCRESGECITDPSLSSKVECFNQTCRCIPGVSKGIPGCNSACLISNSIYLSIFILFLMLITTNRSN